MSRSKKQPWYKDSNPWAKKDANQRVRRFNKDLSNGMSYKNLYSRYDICDWKFYCPDDPKAYRK